VRVVATARVVTTCATLDREKNMREASRIVRAALIVASHALAPELWPATRTATLCRPRGMGDCDGAPAIFVAPGAPVSGATKFQALPVPVGRDAALMMEKAMRGEVFGKVQTLTIAQGLVNRDDGVFDNLPYELAPTKFAKKDLYDRVKGKDWPGRSLKPQSVFDSLRERFGARKAVREADASRDPAKAPYRGAYGFPAGSEDAAARLFAGYASPYALFLEAIDDMLGCSLAGALVEDACPLDDRVDVAGAIRLRPRDGRDEVVVDCYADEAVGLALAAGADVLAERALVEGLSRTVAFGLERRTSVAPLKMRLSVVDDAPAPGYADAVVAEAPETIKSADDYAALGRQGKLRVLASAEEFKRTKGRLPRPRVLAAAGDDVPVDELLIPLLDEAVRRDLAVEAALRDGDVARAAALLAGRSKRHVARDRAAEASREGDFGGELRARDDESVYTAIRADVTQDEGSYDRYLDTDEWYERQRRRTNGAYDPDDDPLLKRPWQT